MSQFGVQVHAKSDRKATGNGKPLRKSQDKRRHEIGGYFVATKLGEANVVRASRGRGANFINKLHYAAFANVLTKNGYKKSKITAVLTSPDNRNFARLAIITKGTIIDTELGQARVNNRPGREGSINAVLTEEGKK
jgi:small subunit ribosomal protein S8e